MSIWYNRKYLLKVQYKRLHHHCLALAVLWYSKSTRGKYTDAVLVFFFEKRRPPCTHSPWAGGPELAHQARASVGQAQGPGAPLSFSSPDVLLSLDLSLTDMNWPWLDRQLPAGVGQAGGRDRPRQLGRCQPCPKIFLARVGHDGAVRPWRIGAHGRLRVQKWPSNVEEWD